MTSFISIMIVISMMLHPAFQPITDYAVSFSMAQLVKLIQAYPYRNTSDAQEKMIVQRGCESVITIHSIIQRTPLDVSSDSIVLSASAKLAFIYFTEREYELCKETCNYALENEKLIRWGQRNDPASVIALYTLRGYAEYCLGNSSAADSFLLSYSLMKDAYEQLAKQFEIHSQSGWGWFLWIDYMVYPLAISDAEQTKPCFYYDQSNYMDIHRYFNHSFFLLFEAEPAQNVPVSFQLIEYTTSLIFGDYQKAMEGFDLIIYDYESGSSQVSLFDVYHAYLYKAVATARLQQDLPAGRNTLWVDMIDRAAETISDTSSDLYLNALWWKYVLLDDMNNEVNVLNDDLSILADSIKSLIQERDSLSFEQELMYSSLTSDWTGMEK